MDTNSDRVPIALVDDHPIYRHGLAAVFRAEARFNVVAEGGSSTAPTMVAPEHSNAAAHNRALASKTR